MNDSNFYKKYRHVGYSYPSVPKGWKPIVKNAIVEIEKEMWPRWIPFFIKKAIHYLATGNSVVQIKYQWAYKLRSKLTDSCMISDIKEKYATLRIYTYGNEKINAIIEMAENLCDTTCMECGSMTDVEVVNSRWVSILCKKCKNKK